jgi:glycosyltransferase involved in cell wall biosynthesis
MATTSRARGRGITERAHGASDALDASTPSANAPVVSVVIPTRDRQQLLRQALESVKSQAGVPARLQVIIADNGLEPGVTQIAEEYGAEYVATRAVGPGAVRNAGLRLARGDYVAFLDDDDAWMPEHLSSHLAVLERDPSLGATVSRMTIGDANARPHGRAGAPAKAPTSLDLFALFLSYFPSVCSVVARRGAVAALGGFDERLIHGEDWDWNLRLALQNQVGFVSRTTFVLRSRDPQSDYDCQVRWIRLGYFHRVFWKHVLRAGDRRPPLRDLVNIYRRQSGEFAIWLCACAEHNLQSGHRRDFALRLAQALVASPPHTVAWWARRWRRRRAWPREPPGEGPE